MKNNIPIFSLEVTQQLLKQGFRLVNIKHNQRYSDKLVFYFEREDNLVKYLREVVGINI